MKTSNSKAVSLSFWLFTAGVMVILTVPTLIQDGMFLDGMLYTSVSHNLGTGTGTFWQPVASQFYTNSGSSFFHEHPPLAFGIQSLFYRVLGDSMYVERLYVFLTMCITAYLIVVLWRNVASSVPVLKDLGWLPVFLWIVIPACFWSYSNNMMENTMGIFDLCAVIFAFKASESSRFREVLYSLAAGFFVFLATMTKGIPGFFPLAVPFLYWLVFRKVSFIKPVLSAILMVSLPLALYFILFNLPESRESLTFYVKERLLQRINEAPTVGSRFYVLIRLFNEMLPLLILSFVVFLTVRIKKLKTEVFDKPYSVFFLLTGLAAAAPLALTMVQRGFYLVPSFPYFAICFGIILAPSVSYFTKVVSSSPSMLKAARAISFAIMIFVIIFTVSKIGKTSRDREMLHDIHAIGQTIPAFSAITIEDDLALTYSLEYYFERYYDIGTHPGGQEQYFLVNKTSGVADTANYRKVDIETKIYDLYMKK